MNIRQLKNDLQQTWEQGTGRRLPHSFRFNESLPGQELPEGTPEELRSRIHILPQNDTPATPQGVHTLKQRIDDYLERILYDDDFFDEDFLWDEEADEVDWEEEQGFFDRIMDWLHLNEEEELVDDIYDLDTAQREQSLIQKLIHQLELDLEDEEYEEDRSDWSKHREHKGGFFRRLACVLLLDDEDLWEDDD